MGKGIELARGILGINSNGVSAGGPGTSPHRFNRTGAKDSWQLHPLAWEYMLPDRPMTRRIDTLEVHSARWGMKIMELDVCFPNSCLRAAVQRDGEIERCLIPAALIPKEPVAVDLEVRDASGGTVAVPTKKECKVLTENAIAEIADRAAGLLDRPMSDFAIHQRLRHRIGDVITQDPLPARISRLHIEAKKSGEVVQQALREWLFPLLRRLEDNYMLWVPIEGPPLGEYHLSIRRSDRRALDRIFPPCRPVEEDILVHSRAGNIAGRWRPASKWRYTFSPSALGARLLVAFGLMPVKFDDEVLEANRFSSYHLAMVPPRGLIVREVKAGEMDEAHWSAKAPKIMKEIRTDLDRTVHGEDSRTGHVHLEAERNPSWFNSRMTIGLRPGMTTLWGAVVVLTCVLLWALHGELGRLLGLEPGTEASDTGVQISAAVLLVGPTFAASWTLRVNDPTLLRNMLGGTQSLLLASAILSVAAALVLAGLTPFGWGPEETVEWYASAAYVIASLIVIGWLQARSLVWLIYRKVLKRAEMNMLATAFLCGGGYVAVHTLEGNGVAQHALLLASGLALTAVAANRTSVRLGENSRKAAALSGLGGLACLYLGAQSIGFFAAIDHDGSFRYVGDALILIGGFSLLIFCWHLIRRTVQWTQQKLEERREASNSFTPQGAS